MSTPRITITQEAHDKLWAYIRAVDTEIGGFGYIKRDGADWTWHETFIVEQKVSTGEVEYSDEGLAQAIERAVTDGVLGKDDFTWVMWHSHGKMATFWSSTDEKDQIQMMRDHSGLSHLVSFVGNHGGDYDLRLDLFDHSLVPHISFTSMPLQRATETQARALAQAEIKQLVTKLPTWSTFSKGSLTKPEKKTPVMDYDEQAWVDHFLDDDLEIADCDTSDEVKAILTGWGFAVEEIPDQDIDEVVERNLDRKYGPLMDVPDHVKEQA